MKIPDMAIPKFVRSKKMSRALLTLGALIILLAVFQAGMAVGFHRASYSYHMGENYYRAFGEGGNGPARMMGDRTFPNAHGAAGTIIKIDLPSLTVLGYDHIEKNITLTESTEIRRLRDKIGAGDLHLDDAIVVFGAPSEGGDVRARFIRIIPNRTDGRDSTIIESPAASSTAPTQSTP
jgi:hypothetical protein